MFPIQFAELHAPGNDCKDRPITPHEGTTTERRQVWHAGLLYNQTTRLSLDIDKYIFIIGYLCLYKAFCYTNQYQLYDRLISHKIMFRK